MTAFIGSMVLIAGRSDVCTKLSTAKKSHWATVYESMFLGSIFLPEKFSNFENFSSNKERELIDSLFKKTT